MPVTYSNIKRAANAIPRYPFTINRQSDQARDLQYWFPFDTGGNDIVRLRQLTPAAAMTLGYAAIPQVRPFLACNDGSATTYSTTDLLGISANIPLTFSLWARRIGVAGSQVVVYCGDNAAWNDACYLSLGGSYEPNMIQVTGGFAAFGVAQATTSLALNQWYFICGTAPSTTNCQIFVNGILEQSATFAAVASGAPDILKLGASWDNNNAFDGQIADLRIYNRALSASEVWALYDPATRYELYQAPAQRRTYIFPASAANVRVSDFNITLGAV